MPRVQSQRYKKKKKKRKPSHISWMFHFTAEIVLKRPSESSGPKIEWKGCRQGKAGVASRSLGFGKAGRLEAWALTQKFRLCSPNSSPHGQEGGSSPGTEDESKRVVRRLSRKERLGEKSLLGLDRVIEGERCKKPEHVEVFVT